MENLSPMKLLLSLSLLLTLALPSGIRAAEISGADSNAADQVAVIETSKGTMVVEFWPEVAPKTVANFKKLANEKFYDGTAFHRILAGFMMQGGDPLTKDVANESMFGTGDPGYKIPAEFNNRKHTRGVLSMARSSDPDSAGSQFFIMFNDAPSLDNNYTAFGKVIRGEDVIELIEKTKTGMARGGEPSKPLERVEVKSVRVVPRSSIK